MFIVIFVSQVRYKKNYHLSTSVLPFQSGIMAKFSLKNCQIMYLALCALKKREERAKKGAFSVKVFQKVLKTTFFGLFFFQIFLRRRNFSQIRVCLVLCASSENQVS